MADNLRFLKSSILIGILVLFLGSCKSTKVLSAGAINDKLAARAVIRNHYNNQIDFKTLSGKVRLNYSDGSSSQGFTVSLRMQKDKAIWLSAPLGVVKAYITPQRVTFYNKLENEYFDGDFSYLDKLLGTDLDFDMLQNLLLGNALFDLRKQKYEVSINNNSYQLKPKNLEELFKTLFQVEPQNFKMAMQQLSQPWKKRMLQIVYKNYQQIDQHILPNEVQITALDEETQITIELDYKNMEFNKPLNFPYTIPKGFKQIVLKENEK